MVSELTSRLNKLALCLYNKRKIYASRYYSRQSVLLDPDNIDGWLTLGDCCIEEADLNGALNCFEIALRLEPRSPLILNNIGVVLSSMGELEAACEWFERSAKVGPEYFDAMANLASLHLIRGEIESAEQNALKALRFNPDCAQAQWCLAQLTRIIHEAERCRR